MGSYAGLRRHKEEADCLACGLQLLGSQDVTYVREVSFVVPSSTAHPLDHPERTTDYHLEPPKLLMASTNLTLAHIMQCRESISYLPHPWPLPLTTALPPPLSQHPLSHASLPSHTLFSQSALIFSTGLFAAYPFPPVGISSASPIEPLSSPRAGTAPQRAVGRKVEKWGADRFVSNAETGRGAMEHAAQKFWKMFAGEGRKEKVRPVGEDARV